MASVSTITTSQKQVMQVYSARTYDILHPRLTKYVEINAPEFTPTIPSDDKFESFSLSANYTANTNYPNCAGTIKMTHYLALPLLQGSNCPVYFKKGTPFLLFTTTGRIEDGYLMYL